MTSQAKTNKKRKSKNGVKSSLNTISKRLGTIVVLEEENFNSIRGILTLTDWDWGGARDCTIPDSLNISYFLQAALLVDLKFSILILMTNKKLKCFPTTNFFLILIYSFVKRFISILFKSSFHQIIKEKYNMIFALFFLFFSSFFFLFPILPLLICLAGAYIPGINASKFRLPSLLQAISSEWQYRMISFKRRDTKLDKFLAKNQHTQRKFGILLPKLFWPTVRKNCSSDRKKLLKFEDEGQEFVNSLRSLEQFIQTVKGQNNFW